MNTNHSSKTFNVTLCFGKNCKGVTVLDGTTVGDLLVKHAALVGASSSCHAVIGGKPAERHDKLTPGAHVVFRGSSQQPQRLPSNRRGGGSRR